MTFRNLIAGAIVLFLSVVTAVAQTPSALKVGFAKCAHCMPMALLPDFAKDVKVEIINFNAGSDVLTALVSKSIDVGQVTYLHFVTALDKGFDVVAISGQVNGGSELLVAPGVDVKAGDWAGLRALVAKNKAEGKPLRLGASRGSAQDIHMRGALFKQGIDVNRDVQFVNIPNPADHLAALRRGEIDMICAVEPFATQIRRADAGKHFAFPYDQAAGRLTNIVVTRSDVISCAQGRCAVRRDFAGRDERQVEERKGIVGRHHQQADRSRQGYGRRRVGEFFPRSRAAPLFDARHRENDDRTQVHRP